MPFLLGSGLGLRPRGHHAYTPSLSASLVASRSLVRATGRTLAATCTSSISLARTATHPVAATCMATVARSQDSARTLAATMMGSITRTQQVAHLAAVSVPVTATVGKALALALTTFAASLSGTGALLRTVGKAFAATLTGTVTRVQAMAHTLAATVTETVAYGKDLALAKAAFAANLPPAPGALLSTPSQQDTFSRANQSGWGTASDGETWNALSGSNTVTLAIAGNNGTIVGSTLNTVYEVALGTATYPACDALVRVSLQDVNANAGFFLTAGSSSLQFNVSFIGTLRWGLSGSGVPFTGASTGITDATIPVWLRLRVQAGVVQARIWQDGTSEPATWTVTRYGAPSVSWRVTLAQVSPSVTLAITPSRFDSFSVTPLPPLSLATGKALAATITAALSALAAHISIKALAATVMPQVIYGREDTFSRADQSGWGTATDGNAWSQLIAGTATRAISGNEGTYTGATSTGVYGLGGPLTGTDCEVLARMKVSAFTVYTDMFLYANFTDFSNYAGLRVNPDGSWQVSAGNAGVFSTTAGGAAGTCVAGTFYWLRVRRESGVLYGSLWADGASEPGTWGGSLSTNLPTAAGYAGLEWSLGVSTHVGTVDHFSARPLPGTVYGVGRAVAKAAAATLTQTTARTRATLKALAASTPASALLARTPLKALATLLRADPAPLVHQDTFIRANSSSGWGTASDGSTWAAISGTPLPTTWGISGNTGTITGQDTVYGAGLGGGAPGADQSVLVRAQGAAGTYAFVILRHDGANFVGAKIKWGGSAGQSHLGTFGATTGNGTVSGLSAVPVAGTPYWVRVQVQGTTLQARVWADGTIEPATWDTMTISLAAAGTVGLGAEPGTFHVTHTVSFDSFSFAQLPAPARAITLARSALGSTLTGAASVGKALGGLARAALGATLPAVPGALLSVPSQQDTFVRANQSGWGTASDGETWSTPAGFTAPTLAISSNTGSLLATTTNAIYGVWLGSATYTNVEVVVRCALNDTHANAGLYLTVPGRAVQLYLGFAGSTVRWQAPNASAPNSGDTGLGVSTLIWLRLRVQGPLYNARVWQDGTAEPAAWSASGAGLTASAWKVLLFTSAPSSSNPISSASTFDSFSVTPLPSLSRTAAHALAATVSGSVVLGRLYAAVRALAASLQPSAAALTRTFDFVRSRLASTLTLTTARTRAVVKALAASTPASALALTPTAQDAFVRPDQNGWGTASDGNTWTVLQTGGYTRAISGNTGTLTDQTNQEILTLGSAPSSPRQEALVRFKVNTFGPQTSLGFLLRYSATSTYIALAVRGSAGTWRVIGLTAGLQTSSDDAGTLSAGTFYWARVRAVDATVYGKVWVDGTTEPTAWGATVTGGTVPLAAGWTALSVQLDTTTDVLFVNSFSATPFQSAQLSRSPAKMLAATLTGLASCGKDLAGLARATFASSLGGASTLLRTAGKTLAASMTALTDLISNFPQVKYFVATCTSTAAYTRTIVHTRAVSLVATARLLRTSTRAFAASLFAAAILARRTEHRVQATLTPALLLLVRDALAVLSSTLGATGHTTRALMRAVVAGSVTLALGAQLGRERVRILAATLQASGALRRTTGKAVVHTIALTTATRRSVVHVLAAHPPLAATLQRATHSTLVAALLGPLGSLRRQARPQLHSVVLLASPARLGYAVLHQLRGTLRAPGTLRRALAYGLVNNLFLTPRLHRATVLLRVGPAAVLATYAGLARTAGPVLRAQLAALARLGHDPAIALRALLPTLPHMRRVTVGQLAGLLLAQGAGIHFIAPLRVALRAGRWLKGALSIRGQATRVRRTAALEVPMRALATVAHRAGALAVPLRAYTLDGARATRLVARRLAPEREDAMIAQPTRADTASLYVAPHEQNVGFTIDMTAALPASTHVASVEVLAVTAKYPGQPEDAAAVISGFATGPGLASDVITLVVGDGQQLEGLDYEVVLLATYDNDPVTTATIYVEIPCRKGAPQP